MIVMIIFLEMTKEKKGLIANTLAGLTFWAVGQGFAGPSARSASMAWVAISGKTLVMAVQAMKMI